MALRRAGIRVVGRVALPGPALLLGCTLDITDAGDPPGDELEPAPARLGVLSDLSWTPTDDGGGGFLMTRVELHPGVDAAGDPRLVVPRPLALHGVDVEPEEWFSEDGVQTLRWLYQDSASADVRALSLTPPTISGLPTPPAIDLRVGIRVEPEGDIVLGPSEDLVLEVDFDGAPPDLFTAARTAWSLRVGHLVTHAEGVPASTLIIPSGWLEGIELPGTLDLSFGMIARYDPAVSPGYLMDVRIGSAVQRRVVGSPD